MQPPYTNLETAPYSISSEFLSQVLKPYKPHTTYLKSASILSVQPATTTNGSITATANFQIPESCYIDDTGHFNSVEFNICLNQILYTAVGHSVEQKLFAQVAPEWNAVLNYNYQHFLTYQLIHMLILKIEATFKKQIPSAALFQAELHLHRFFQRSGILFMQANINFSHAGEVKAKGSTLTSFQPNS